jgi:hypothetical protein
MLSHLSDNDIEALRRACVHEQDKRLQLRFSATESVFRTLNSLSTVEEMDMVTILTDCLCHVPHFAPSILSSFVPALKGKGGLLFDGSVGWVSYPIAFYTVLNASSIVKVDLKAPSLHSVEDICLYMSEDASEVNDLANLAFSKIVNMSLKGAVLFTVSVSKF